MFGPKKSRLRDRKGEILNYYYLGLSKALIGLTINAVEDQTASWNKKVYRKVKIHDIKNSPYCKCVDLYFSDSSADYISLDRSNCKGHDWPVARITHIYYDKFNE